jgi:hypothetical protein
MVEASGRGARSIGLRVRHIALRLVSGQTIFASTFNTRNKRFVAIGVGLLLLVVVIVVAVVASSSGGGANPVSSNKSSSSSASNGSNDQDDIGGGKSSKIRCRQFHLSDLCGSRSVVPRAFPPVDS